MGTSDSLAPGAPGISPRWTSSAKSAVGTALSQQSRVWFTLSHGIFNEIYYPSIDRACIRDMGLIVTSGKGFFSEEKRDTASETRWLAEGVPAFGLTSRCSKGCYLIEKQVVTDPNRDTALQRVGFIARQGALSDYRLYVLLAPHLGNRGWVNSRACRYCLPSATATHWRWHARCRGSGVPPATSGYPTAGRICTRIGA